MPLFRNLLPFINPKSIPISSESEHKITRLLGQSTNLIPLEIST